MATKAPRVSVQITADSTGYTAAVNKARGQLIQFQQVSKQVSHSAVTDVQATSGALRILDGGIQNNIRSAERFLANIKGVGAAMQFIYPAVGLIAVGAVLAKGVATLVEFTKKTKEAGAEFRASFQEMQNSARLSNDELAKTNINLENQIAKLTGKHENVLASQLIEARIEADHLAMSAAAAAKQMKDLLEKNQAGVLARVMGSGPTKEVFGNIENFQNLKSGAQQRRDDALHNGDKASADAANADYQQAIANERAYIQQQIKLRSGYVKYAQTATGPALISTDKNDPDATTYGKSQGDQTRNLDALHAALNLNYDQSDRIDLDAQHNKDTGTLKGIQDAQSFATKQMEQYKQQFAQLQASLVAGSGEEDAQFKARMLTEEAQFWAQKLSMVAKGSQEYKAIQQQLAEIDRQANQQFAQAQTEQIRLQQERDKFISSSFGDQLDLSRDSDTLGGLRTGGKDTQSMLTAMNESVKIANENVDAWAEAQTQIGLATGTISKYDAAMQTLQLHRQQYDRSNASLAASRASLTARYGANPTSPEGRAAFDQLDNQQAQLDGTFRVQSTQDQQNITAQTGGGALKQSMNQYIEQSRDTASQVRDIWSESFSGINEQLEDMLSGQKTSWKSFLGGIATDFANIFLQRGESALIGSLFGEPGSKSGGGLTSLFSGIGSLFSGLGFADGGMPPVGVASLVGERGPELFVPHTAGTVVPNNQIGGTTQHVAIDARGATDPAAVEAAVNRAMAKHASTQAAMTIGAQRDRRARQPNSHR